jgi:hypothetical protein
VPLYIAHYETACMTRQHLEQIVRDAEAASGACRSQQYVVSLSGGHMLWMFEAPARETLESWLKVLRMGNYLWLARVDYVGEGGALRDV